MLISNFPGGKKIEGTATPSDVMAGETFMSANSNALQTGTLTVDDIVDGMEDVTITTTEHITPPYVIDQTGYRVIAVIVDGRWRYWHTSTGTWRTAKVDQYVVFNGTYAKFIDYAEAATGRTYADVTYDGTSLSITREPLGIEQSLESGAVIKILRIPR